MKWHYRVIKHLHPQQDWFGIHEVYIDSEGKISWSAEPIKIAAETYNDIKKQLELMNSDLCRQLLVVNQEGKLVDLQ
jgi:hypothetical protein